MSTHRGRPPPPCRASSVTLHVRLSAASDAHRGQRVKVKKKMATHLVSFILRGFGASALYFQMTQRAEVVDERANPKLLT